MVNILKREGANAVCMAKFYMAVVQAVLLYGAESWSITDRNMRRLRSFHHRVLRYLTGKHICKRGEIWEFPNHEELCKEVRLLPIEKYIERRRGTLRHYLDENRRELMNKALRTNRHSYEVKKVLWWNQKWIQKRGLREFSNRWFST